MNDTNKSKVISVEYRCCGTPTFFLNEEYTIIYQWIIFTFVCQAVDIFGVGTNIINIICFVKQGFKDPVNITLLGLAVADMGCLATLVWTNICYTPAFSFSDLPFHTMEFQYLTSSLPHATFARVTGWITAIITLERCLCITAPLKVKRIITPRRVSILVVSVFIVLIGSASPPYVVNRLGKKFYPKLNKTLLGLISSSNRESVEKVSFAINNVFIPGSAFFLITFCTITLVYKLHERTKWRTKSTAQGLKENISTRNRKVAKMIVMISTLFIVCFIPLCLVFIGVVKEPELSIDGKYKNGLTLYGGLCFLLESINSSFNIFIYYHMSTNYRLIFRKLFLLNVDRNAINRDG